METRTEAASHLRTHTKAKEYFESGNVYYQSGFTEKVMSHIESYPKRDGIPVINENTFFAFMEGLGARFIPHSFSHENSLPYSENSAL